MKKKVIIPVIIAVVLAILFVPIPTGVYKDGGTREYSALTYKIVKWNRLTGDSTYDKTRLYFFPYNFKSIDGLWHLEKDNVKPVAYTDTWLQKNEETKWKETDNLFWDIKITKIHSNCFFAKTVVPMPYEIKLNGKLEDKWCVGDQVICTYENTYYDSETGRVECDFLTVKESDFELQEAVDYKPVIYLYPEKQTEVSVKLELDGGLTCTYPEYKGGWNVTAEPDGTLTDSTGQTYNYLYWEGKTFAQYDLSKGFCVKGKDTAKFLEYALKNLGLNRKEANEFIVYWLPLMQDNPYNIISFQTDIYTDAAKLEISPKPDTLIRVFMAWQASDNYVELPEQTLLAPERNGFTVIEWGGTEIKR